jgi:hypothetical protein
MTRAILVALGTGTIITSAAAIGIGAPREKPAEFLTRPQFEAALDGLERSMPGAQARCEPLAAAERELCQARVSADEMVRAADLEERFQRSVQAARGAQRARIEARYVLARARCAAVRGHEHDQCLIEAHAARGRALLETHDPYVVRPG